MSSATTERAEGATLRWEVRHASVFQYAAPVEESQNELRACPTTDDVQTLLHHRVVLDPGARVHAHLDYWGTRAETFGVRGPHDRLEVVAESTVAVGPRHDPPREVVPLEALGAATVRDEHGELLELTPHTSGTALVAAAAEVAVDGGVWALALALRDLTAERVTRASTRTPPGRTAAEAWDAGTGDATDRTQVLATLLRSRGVPTCHVAGYVGGRGGDQDGAHAWVEVLLPGHGWHALDPDGPVGRGHVTVGRARDHADVAPLRGAFVGDPEHVLDVTVAVTRVAELAPAPRERWPGGRGMAQQQVQQQQ